MAHALLHVENLSATVDPDGQRDEQQRRGKNYQQEGRGNNVHQPLRQATDPLQPHIVDCHKRQSRQLLLTNHRHHQLEVVREHPDVDPLRSADTGDLEQQFRVGPRQRDDHLVDGVLDQRATQNMQRAEHRNRYFRIGVVVILQPPDHRVAGPRIADQQVVHRQRLRAAAEKENPFRANPKVSQNAQRAT